MIVLAGGGVAETQDSPVSSRHIPGEAAVFGALLGEVHDAITRHGRSGAERER